MELPHTAGCLVCGRQNPHGLKLSLHVDEATGIVRMDFAPRPEHIGFEGIVHGGVLATLIDTATFWAAFMRLPEDAGLVNVDLKLNYLKAVVNGHLRAEGECLRAGKQISYTVASVFNESGELVAHGTSTMMALPGKGLNIAIPKFLAD